MIDQPNSRNNWKISQEPIVAKEMPSSCGLCDERKEVGVCVCVCVSVHACMHVCVCRNCHLHSEIHLAVEKDSRTIFQKREERPCHIYNLQDFHNPSEVWGGDGAKHTYILYKNRESKKENLAHPFPLVFYHSITFR